MTVIPSNPTFLFSQLKIKLKGCHFHTTEMIEAKLHAVLNTLTEHVFQDAFKISRSTWNGVHAWKGATLRVTEPCQ
jgi:hypothetical protein